MGPISDPGICPDKSAQPGDLILEFTHFLTQMDILKEIYYLSVKKKHLYILFWLIYGLFIHSQVVLDMSPKSCGFIKFNLGTFQASCGLIPG